MHKHGYPLGSVVLTASEGHLFQALPRRDPEFGLDTLLLKYDQKGNLLWEQKWGTAKDDMAMGIASHRNRIYLVGNTLGSVGGELDAFLVEIDARSGEVLSPHFYGGKKEDVAWGVIPDENNLYLVGHSRSFNPIGWKDLMLLEYSLIPKHLKGELPREKPGRLVPGKPGQVPVVTPPSSSKQTVAKPVPGAKGSKESSEPTY